MLFYRLLLLRRNILNRDAVQNMGAVTKQQLENYIQVITPVVNSVKGYWQPSVKIHFLKTNKFFYIPAMILFQNGGSSVAVTPSDKIITFNIGSAYQDEISLGFSASCSCFINGAFVQGLLRNDSNLLYVCLNSNQTIPDKAPMFINSTLITL